MNTLTKSSAGTAQRSWVSRNRVLIALFVVVLALIPIVPTPEFWITLLNYIGLYSLVALGLVLLTGVGVEQGRASLTDGRHRIVAMMKFLELEYAEFAVQPEHIATVRAQVKTR